MQENFNASRKSLNKEPKDDGPAMYLATVYDKTSEAWTKISPNSSVSSLLTVWITFSYGLILSYFIVTS